jgi:hypothetical protein
MSSAATQRRKLVLAALAAGAAALLAIASTSAMGPGMMGGSASGAFGPGMMGGLFGGVGAGGAGASGTAKPSASQLATIRSRIETWLGANGFRGFTVAEVMAFTNNDYVAVHDRSGKPAFELLTNLTTSWVMEEPPSMMWNTRYGMTRGLGADIAPMMGGSYSAHGWNGWYGTGSGQVTTIAKAVEVANAWLANGSPGERVASDAGGSALGKFPGYYTFDATRNGETVGMLSVNATTGAVWYHAWHGNFLAERDFTA